MTRCKSWLTRLRAGTLPWRSTDDVPRGKEAQIRGLAPGRPYELRVVTRSDIGESISHVTEAIAGLNPGQREARSGGGGAVGVFCVYVCGNALGKSRDCAPWVEHRARRGGRCQPFWPTRLAARANGTQPLWRQKRTSTRHGSHGDLTLTTPDGRVRRDLWTWCRIVQSAQAATSQATSQLCTENGWSSVSRVAVPSNTGECTSLTRVFFFLSRCPSCNIRQQFISQTFRLLSNGVYSGNCIDSSPLIRVLLTPPDYATLDPLAQSNTRLCCFCPRIIESRVANVHRIRIHKCADPETE